MCSYPLGCSSGNTGASFNNPKPSPILPSTFLKIIPVSPAYLPGKSEQDAAKKFLAKFYPEGQIEVVNNGTIEFIDPGENLDSIVCNLCRQTINIESWQGTMEKAYRN